MEIENYPMCGARIRAGGSCRQPAMKNGRCYYHGGKSKAGREHGRYRSGEHTKEAIAERRYFQELIQEAQRFLKEEL
jgi:hypothetical protein